MGIAAKLQQWQAAGLIDDATRERILAHERGHERPVLLYALGAIGALTIGIGVIAIVAANWDAIDRQLKLGIDLLAGVLLSLAIYRNATRETRDGRWLTEVLVGIYYLYVLASLSLIGQIYQLGSPVHHGLLAWSLSTAPLMLLARTPLLGFVWLAGLVCTEMYTSVFYLQLLENRMGYDDELLRNIFVTLVFVLTLGHLWLARARWFESERPAVSAAWTSSLWFAIVATGFALSFVFYGTFDAAETLGWAVAVTGVLVAAFAASLPSLYPSLPARAVVGMQLLLGAVWLVLAVGTGTEHDSMSAVGALAQVAILAIAAWTVLQLGRLRLFNVLTGLIALRVLFVYFEVFGSLLDTGVGLISGGLLTLLLAWAWKRKSPELAARLGHGDTSRVA